MKIFEFLAMFSLDRICGLIFDLIKSYALRMYIDVMDGVRSVFSALILALGCLLIFFCGFLMLHVALFLSLPWSLEHKLILLTGLGTVYLTAPIILICRLQSKERWLEMTGVKKSVDDFQKKAS